MLVALPRVRLKPRAYKKKRCSSTAMTCVRESMLLRFGHTAYPSSPGTPVARGCSCGRCRNHTSYDGGSAFWPNFSGLVTAHDPTHPPIVPGGLSKSRGPSGDGSGDGSNITGQVGSGRVGSGIFFISRVGMDYPNST